MIKAIETKVPIETAVGPAARAAAKAAAAAIAAAARADLCREAAADFAGAALVQYYRDPCNSTRDMAAEEGRAIENEEHRREQDRYWGIYTPIYAALCAYL
jgi:hypothetical protein